MNAAATTAQSITAAITFLGAAEHADGQLYSTGGNVDDDGTSDPILLTRADVERLAVLLEDNDENDAFNVWGGSSIGAANVAVASVKAGEADGSVEAHLVVVVEGSVTECEVTL